MEKYINERDPREFLDQFRVLDVNESVVNMAYDFIRKYSMLPNDAIILATCKFHEIDLLASLDRDFEEVCKLEGLRFASSSENIRNQNVS
ncbi:PIN domain-containing protein [Archaeoglobus sp.]